MSACECGVCNNIIYYHGEPENNYPIQHIFCNIDNWYELEKENLSADCLELEHEDKFFYAWRCPQCGSFIFFNELGKVINIYVSQDKFSTEPMQEPVTFGLVWTDLQWFNITENRTPTAEVLVKYPDTCWFTKNDKELRIYSDKKCTKCISQYSCWESK